MQHNDEHRVWPQSTHATRRAWRSNRLTAAQAKPHTTAVTACRAYIRRVNPTLNPTMEQEREWPAHWHEKTKPKTLETQIGVKSTSATPLQSQPLGTPEAEADRNDSPSLVRASKYEPYEPTNQKVSFPHPSKFWGAQGEKLSVALFDIQNWLTLSQTPKHAWGVVASTFLKGATHTAYHAIAMRTHTNENRMIKWDELVAALKLRFPQHNEVYLARNAFLGMQAGEPVSASIRCENHRSGRPGPPTHRRR